MRNLWNRARQLVLWARGRYELVPVALDEVPPYPDHGTGHWVIPDSATEDVLRLLHRDEPPTPSRPGPGFTGGLGIGPGARAVSGESDASFTVTYDSVAGYGD